MQNDPHQAKKTIFMKFDQWGMGLGMFWWSNRLKLGNLSLIYEIMRICEKKLDTFRIHHFKYWNSLNRYPIGIFAMSIGPSEHA